MRICQQVDRAAILPTARKMGQEIMANPAGGHWVCADGHHPPTHPPYLHTCTHPICIAPPTSIHSFNHMLFGPTILHQAFIKVVFLVAVVAVVGSQAPAAFGTFNKGGTHTTQLVACIGGPAVSSSSSSCRCFAAAVGVWQRAALQEGPGTCQKTRPEGVVVEFITP